MCSSITRPTIGGRAGIPIYTGRGYAMRATTIYPIAEISAWRPACGTMSLAQRSKDARRGLAMPNDRLSVRENAAAGRVQSVGTVSMKPVEDREVVINPGGAFWPATNTHHMTVNRSNIELQCPESEPKPTLMSFLAKVLPHFRETLGMYRTWSCGAQRILNERLIVSEW
jgi:hypothetical protein